MTVGKQAHAPIFVCAFLLSAVAQLCFRSASYRGGLIASALAAAAIWLSRPGAVDETPEAIAHDGSRPLRPRFRYVALAMLAVVLILQHFDYAYALQIALWLSAIAMLNAAYRSLAWAERFPSLEIIAVVEVLVAAFVLRAYDLEFYPTGLHGDEGNFGLWAVRILDGERIPPFALGWDSHATLFHYAQAAAMTIAGKTVAGARLASAVLGALTILPFHLFIRRVLGSRAALAAAALLALLPWHLYFSRLAVDDIGVALCTVGAMAALYEARRGDGGAVAAGTWLGLSLYCGHKAVMVPAMLAGGLVVLHATGHVDLRRQWRRWILLGAIAACVVAPQFAFYARAGWYAPLLQHPLARLVGHDDHQEASPNGADLAVQQVERSVLAFQLHPDRSIFLGFTGVPLLPRGIAALYFVGLILCLCRLRQPLSAFLLVWFAIGLLASILTKDPPQAHHLVPMITVPIAFAAIALCELGKVFSGSRRMPALFLLLVAVVLVDAGREAWTRYAAPTPWLEVTEIARAMHALDQTHDVVLVTAPMSDSNGALRFIAGDAMRAPKLYAELRQPWDGPTNRDLAFIVSWRRYRELSKLRSWYPNGREYKYATVPGADFLTIYEVAKSDVYP